MSGTLQPGTASLPLSPALGAGWEAQGTELAEISRASYLPKPACSHKSQNRVPGRAVNSEMQRQLQRKIVERNRQESCLPLPPVSEGSWRGQGHRGVSILRNIHPPSLQIPQVSTLNSTLEGRRCFSVLRKWVFLVCGIKETCSEVTKILIQYYASSKCRAKV